MLHPVKGGRWANERFAFLHVEEHRARRSPLTHRDTGFGGPYFSTGSLCEPRSHDHVLSRAECFINWQRGRMSGSGRTTEKRGSRSLSEYRQWDGLIRIFKMLLDWR